MAYFWTLFLFFIVSNVWADQQAHHGEASILTRTITDDQSDLDVTDGQYQEIEDAFKALTEDVDTLIPIPVLDKIADMIVFFNGETQISDKLIADQFSNIESLRTSSHELSLSTPECKQTFSTYVFKHNDPAFRARVKVQSLATGGEPEMTGFKISCRLKSYMEDLPVFAHTLKHAPFGMLCLTANNYSYTELLKIKRIIKIDTFAVVRFT
uniref:Secreted protein n=1 Tax=Steinernema glaseri TaxID=37863 RepID=A0A1I7XWW2_9BILA